MILRLQVSINQQKNTLPSRVGQFMMGLTHNSFRRDWAKYHSDRLSPVGIPFTFWLSLGPEAPEYPRHPYAARPAVR